MKTLACALLTFVTLGSRIIGAEEQRPLKVLLTQNTRTVPVYDVLELTFQHEERYANPFFDVDLQITFRAPSGKTTRIGGFHYGCSTGTRVETKIEPAAGGHGERRRAEYRFDKQDLWKARFAPAETGRWTFTYTFANHRDGRATGSGTFDCVRGRRHLHGFVRQHPGNPFRWTFDDGCPYFPIGLQECIADSAGVGSVLAAQSMEGPFRLDRRNRPDPPPGALFKPAPANNPVNGDVYLGQYGRAGFNLFRFSQKNCSLELYRNLDQYLVHEAIMVDELLRCARQHGFRIFYGLFGYQPVFNDQPENEEGMNKLKRFVKYSVDRWGAYVDFWEFLNEQKADARWYAVLAPYLRSLDPYAHPIATSWERPELPGIEVNAPHWYSGVMDELNCDVQTVSHATAWKRFNKPVIVGEQGNTASKEQLQRPGIGGVWDPRSATRMRVRNWTALFNDVSFIFWNTSYARDGHYMNIWLGPQERQYVHAMQDFATHLDGDVQMVPVTVSAPKQVRAYGLASRQRGAVYLHHFASHSHAISNVTVTVEVPRASSAYWYFPEDATVPLALAVSAGRQTLAAPAFTVDLALLLGATNAPDIDRDGVPNDRDGDDDNDGVPDTRDAFPIDADEWADTDGDLIGDNMDADVDADGVGDDRNHNGKPDFEEMDLDGDGVPKANAIPWDVFPLDPKEWRDTDGDGLGDKADPDRDGDGWSNEEERTAGTDPSDGLSFPSGK